MATIAQKISAYARLLRLSNAPTAVADVWMGYAVVSGALEPTLALAVLSLTSLSLYHGGMVLNDAVDADRDSADDRGRPIQQGVVTRRSAYWLAAVLLGAPLLLAAVLVFYKDVTLGVSFSLLALFLLVVAYDSRLKATVAGPMLMALCRIMNVYLGVGAAGRESPYFDRTEYAFLGILFYVLGLTLFARSEASGGNRRPLMLGFIVAVFGVMLYACKPLFYIGVPGKTVPAVVAAPVWWLIWAAVAAFCLRGMVAAILQPTPRNIGRGVGIAIQGIIVIDATLAALYAGPMAGLAIFALLPVTMLLSRWIPQT